MLCLCAFRQTVIGFVTISVIKMISLGGVNGIQRANTIAMFKWNQKFERIKHIKMANCLESKNQLCGQNKKKYEIVQTFILTERKIWSYSSFFWLHCKLDKSIKSLFMFIEINSARIWFSKCEYFCRWWNSSSIYLVEFIWKTLNKPNKNIVKLYTRFN